MRQIFIGACIWIATVSAYSESRCNERFDTDQNPISMKCTYRQRLVSAGFNAPRFVKYQLPIGAPPATGWPAVIIYQGSYFTVEFSRLNGLPYGAYHEIELIRKLLDNGYAVFAPRAAAHIAWMTNLQFLDYEMTGDFAFISNLIEEISTGEFGPIDSKRLYATGISSGGYNTSRMAVSFPGAFKALAIQSASYATCMGSTCSVPDALPSNHPPTLLLHGEKDLIVPLFTAKMYTKSLIANGIQNKLIVNRGAGHQWIPEASEEILTWFEQHR